MRDGGKPSLCNKSSAAELPSQPESSKVCVTLMNNCPGKFSRANVSKLVRTHRASSSYKRPFSRAV